MAFVVHELCAASVSVLLQTEIDVYLLLLQIRLEQGWKCLDPPLKDELQVCDWTATRELRADLGMRQIEEVPGCGSLLQVRNEGGWGENLGLAKNDESCKETYAHGWLVNIEWKIVMFQKCGSKVDIVTHSPL